jgi:catechol 2,3-dioxygenase-like lactoylglutathione lyase family enzyme
MIKTEGLTHIHLVVRDLHRSVRFYREVFGMTERFRVGSDMVFLSTPGSRDLITLNRDEAAAANAGKNGGIAHFGFRLLDRSQLDAAIQEVERAGGRLVSRGEHAPGVPYAYVADPEGYVIELEMPARPRRARSTGPQSSRNKPGERSPSKPSR